MLYAPLANYRYRGIENWGSATGKTDGWQRAGVVCDRRAQHEGRLPGQRCWTSSTDDRRRHAARLPVQPGVPNAVSYWLPDMGRRTITKLHGIFVQDRGRAAGSRYRARCVGPRVELRAGGRERHDRDTSFLNPRRSPSRRRPASTPTTTSRRAWASRMTCSATGRRRSSSTGAGTWPTRRTIRRTRRQTRAPRSCAAVNREWNAAVAAGGNGDHVVDCNLLNPDANGECAAADRQRPRTSARLGAAHAGRSGVLSGWGVRPGDTQTPSPCSRSCSRACLRISTIPTEASTASSSPTTSIATERRRLRELHADGAAGFPAGRWWRLSGDGVRADSGGERRAPQTFLTRESRFRC